MAPGSGFQTSSWIELPKGGLSCVLEEDKTTRQAATRIGCTLGPATRDVGILQELLQAGMKVARFDFTYGNAEYHQETLNMLRQAMENTRTSCAIMLDTCGPEITIVNRPQEPIQLQAGQAVTLTVDRTQQASAAVLPISLLDSFEGCNIAPGTSVHVGQYLFTGAETSSAYLTVQQVSPGSLTCVCNNTCTLEGLMLTAYITNFRYPGEVLTPEDVTHITTWGKANEVDFVSLAFVRSAEDVVKCRAVLEQCGMSSCKVWAKIETLEALAAREEIMAACDAVIFSRGNLGLELDPEKVFLAQKMLLRAANVSGKPVFVTRVVDTMSEAPRPTRAEATDVANLVLDGADGVLLGSETFRGKYPVSTVQTVAAIALQAESCFDNGQFYRALMLHYGCYTIDPRMEKHEALTSSAVRAATKMDAKLIVVFTVTGRTARLMAKYKPRVPILAVVCKDASSTTYDNKDSFTEAPRAPRRSMSQEAVGNMFTWRHSQQGRQCEAYRGVIPISARDGNGAHSGELLDSAIDYAKAIGLVSSGDRVVVSQCPRPEAFDKMDEAGVVKLVTVDDTMEGAFPRNCLGGVKIAIMGGGAVHA